MIIRRCEVNRASLDRLFIFRLSHLDVASLSEEFNERARFGWRDVDHHNHRMLIAGRQRGKHNGQRIQGARRRADNNGFDDGTAHVLRLWYIFSSRTKSLKDEAW